MKRKIFLSVAIPESTKKSLKRAVERWKDLPIKWTKQENLYLTLMFLGYLEDEDVLKIIEKITSAVKDFPIFDLSFEAINLGPSEEDPHLVRLIGQPDDNLKKLNERLEKALGIFIREKKAFRPQIILGRIRKNLWQPLDEPLRIAKDFPLNLSVESVLILGGGFVSEAGEYAILENCPLQ